MKDLDFSSKVEISPDVLYQEVNGESVLLDLKSESYFGLDATGTRIWQLMQESQGLQGAYEVMLSEFDVDRDQLRQDISKLLGELSGAGLVSLESPA